MTDQPTPKDKAPARDYGADVRVDPPPEDATTKELWTRGHSFVKAVLGGAGAKKPDPAAE